MNQNRTSTRTRSLCLAALTGASSLLLAAPAPAQSNDQAPAAEEPLKLEKFVVVGSSIPTAEGETFSPTVVFTPGEMSLKGAATPIEVIRTMPGFIGAVTTEQRTNGGSGSANVNLRGLAGTLSLLEGRSSAVLPNYNLLPTIAIGRVEVLKDGAGAVYGANALAGVFNVHLVKKYEGQKLDVYYGNTVDKDQGALRIGAMAGASAGKFDAVVAYEFFDRNALHATDRAVSANADLRSIGGQNGGSPSFSGRVMGRRSPGGPVEALTLAPGVVIPMTANDYVAFDPVAATSNQFLNFRQYTPSIPGQTRNMAYGRVNWEITENVSFYARLLFSKDSFFNGLAPSPMPTGGTAGTALRNAVRLSPHVPVGLIVNDGTNATGPGNLIIGSAPFRTIALGPRIQKTYRTAWDLATGFEGRFGNWQWEMDFIYGWLYSNGYQAGAPGLSRLAPLIVSGAYNPFALDTAKGTGPTGIAFDNPAALRSAEAEGTTFGKFPVRGGGFNAGGPIWTIPAGEVMLGLGGDYYRNDVSNRPEPIFFQGELLGLNAANPTVSRALSAGAFAELQIPLVSEDMGIPLVRKLELQLQGRYDFQTTEGYQNGVTGNAITRRFTAHTPKVGLKWTVTDELMLRGTWGTGFRLPTLGQLFGAAGASFPQLRDPLNYPIANQTQISTGGNNALDPEESKTYSAGFVYSPKGIKGLSIVFDYYYGAINGLVGEGSQFILDQNAATQGSSYVPGNPATLNPNALFANLITRNPTTGSVTTVNSTNFNISSRETTGIDWAVTYVWPKTDFGKFTSRVEWNTTLSWDLTPIPGAAPQSYLGLYIDVSTTAISPGSIPKHKGFFTNVWEHGSWGAVLTANYIGELADDMRFAGTVNPPQRMIDAWLTWDAQMSYKFSGGEGWMKWLDKTTVRVGAANLLDEDPPQAFAAFNDNYDVTTHSNRGRFVYLQLTKEF